MSLIDATSADWRSIPPHLRGGIERWVYDGIPPGHFLTCVLKNDLAGAATYGDSESTAALVGIVRFLREHCPRQCWGGVAAFATWPERLAEMRAA
jgi:hypothetical protein